MRFTKDVPLNFGANWSNYPGFFKNILQMGSSQSANGKTQWRTFSLMAKSSLLWML